MIRLQQHTRHAIRNPNAPITYHVAIEEWVWWKWFRYELYHWYDMRIPVRLPGWKRFDEWLRKNGAQHRHFQNEPKARLQDKIYGWTVEQDFRCYRYSTFGEKIVEVTVEEGEYEAISRGRRTNVRRSNAQPGDRVRALVRSGYPVVERVVGRSVARLRSRWG